MSGIESGSSPAMTNIKSKMENAFSSQFRDLLTVPISGVLILRMPKYLVYRLLGLGTPSPITEELSDLAGFPYREDGVQSCL
jgi:hypothetical protein